jgi:hypothetical protein
MPGIAVATIESSIERVILPGPYNTKTGNQQIAVNVSNNNEGTLIL